jgi:hypothetical protein
MSSRPALCKTACSARFAGSSPTVAFLDGQKINTEDLFWKIWIRLGLPEWFVKRLEAAIKGDPNPEFVTKAGGDAAMVQAVHDASVHLSAACVMPMTSDERVHEWILPCTTPNPTQAWAKDTGADLAKTNVNGGAIAIGHPLGASGARIMTTMVNALQQRGGRYALQTMCEGGGMPNATIIERL